MGNTVATELTFHTTTPLTQEGQIKGAFGGGHMEGYVIRGWPDDDRWLFQEIIRAAAAADIIEKKEGEVV